MSDITCLLELSLALAARCPDPVKARAEAIDAEEGIFETLDLLLRRVLALRDCIPHVRPDGHFLYGAQAKVRSGVRLVVQGRHVNFRLTSESLEFPFSDEKLTEVLRWLCMMSVREAAVADEGEDPLAWYGCISDNTPPGTRVIVREDDGTCTHTTTTTAPWRLGDCTMVVGLADRRGGYSLRRVRCPIDDEVWQEGKRGSPQRG